MGEFCAPKASLTLGSSYISVIVHGITPNVSITKETIPVSKFSIISAINMHLVGEFYL